MSALVIAPEPAAWLAAVLARHPEARVFAPWARPRPPANLWPRPLRAFLERRVLPNAITLPGFVAVDGATHLWARGRADRQLALRFAQRRVVDRLAAAWILRERPALVVAPSCAARHAFAAAARVRADTILVEDLPDIRGLHDDLDRAAAAHPDCAFLRRYRAPARVVARQEAERVLAGRLWVRGRWARAQRERTGVDPARIAALDDPPARPLRRRAQGGRRRILLAGLAAARHGTLEIADALAGLPDVELVIRPGEGMEPADLLRRPRVVTDDGHGVDVVVAPAWCEAYLPDVAGAAAAGIPVVATLRAAGFAKVTEVPVGDAAALAAAIRAL